MRVREPGRRAAPRRTCVGCGERDEQGAMLRLRATGPGRVAEAARPAGAGQGRSAYVHEREGCVNGLVRSRSLERSLRQKIAAEIRRELAADLMSRLDRGRGTTEGRRAVAAEAAGRKKRTHEARG